MRLNDATRAAVAVDAVTGEVFRDGWSRIRGSMQGLHASRQKQLVRAAAGHRAAVFKAIRSGGTHTKGQLSNQLDYLTTKSTHIVDSSGFLDGKSKLESGEIKDLTERFSKRWSAGFKPKLGQTTHLLMSFPIGTRGEDVRDIASDVAERFFQNDEGHFDYIIAVHEDRDHPHAHIVLNRRSQEGEFFYLARDHRFNYDDFRLAMVEEAEKYGVRLEATRRIDRGVVHYPPRTREVYAAKAEGRTAEPRPRVGADLERAIEEIANTRIIYHSLAAEVSKDNHEDIAEALLRAGKLLAKGGRLNLEGDVYMAEEHSFDDLKVRYAEQVERVQGMIAEKPETERPRLEKSLNEIQARLAHMQPLGLRSHTLSEAPSDGGVYSEANIDREQLDRLQEPEVRAQIDTALRGTGIRTGVVIARMETGAQNAALERQWIADDLQRVAETEDLNLERRDDLETARETLNRTHVQLGIALERSQVLRDDGVIEETVDDRADLREDLGAEVTVQAPVERQATVDEELQRVIEHEREGNLSSPFADAEDRQSYRDAVERDLDDVQLDRLRAGDADVLKNQIEDRLDRLYVAKSYLQSDAATANSEATRAVVEEIADREYELHRADTIDSETERGPTHG
ncbi:relaxase/mobilization nuclease domain-containing protein [Octadecabacter sp. R77987]|uniref:relaxase/mobilization nuclease domain-containing protein n=1 Tax=Octadecabacter sp. R77987 TaxID=3093874 RepID=UPI00366DF9D4